MSALIPTAFANPPTKKPIFLFIDLNAGTEEIATARRLASSRGEEFRVVPVLSDAERAAFATKFRINEEPDPREEAIRARVYRTLKSMPPEQELKVTQDYSIKLREAFTRYGADSPEVRDLRESYLNGIKLTPTEVQTIRAVRKRQEDARKKTESIQVRHIDGPELKNILHQLKQGGRTITHVTISGHDGGGGFFGELGELDPFKLKSELGEDASELESVRSVALLGCYAGNSKAYNQLKRTFPALDFLYGYDSKAPLNYNQNGLQYYGTFLGSEKKLLAAKDQASAEKAVQLVHVQLAKFNRSDYSPSVSFAPGCTGDVYFYTSSANRITTVTQNCRVDPKEKAAQFKVLADSYTGDSALPTNTSSGPLRDAYSFVRRNEACLGTDGNPFPAHSTALLLFWQNGTKRNFFAYRGNEIKACLSQLERASPSQVAENAQKTRAELEANNQLLSDTVRNVLSQQFGDPASNHFASAWETTRDVLEKLYRDQPATLRGQDMRTRLLTIYDVLNEMPTDGTEVKWSQAKQIVNYVIGHPRLPGLMDATVAQSALTDLRNSFSALAPTQWDSLDRKKLRNLLETTDNALTNANQAQMIDSFPDLACLNQVHQELEDELFDMHCAPFSWHEYDENATPEPSLCGRGGARPRLEPYILEPSIIAPPAAGMTNPGQSERRSEGGEASGQSPYDPLSDPEIQSTVQAFRRRSPPSPRPAPRE